MYRKLLAGLAISMVAAGAAAVTVRQDAPAAAAAPAQESPTAEVFAASLVNGINEVLAAYAGTDLVELQTLLEQSIESVFVSSNASPEVALEGVNLARTTLTSTGVMCELPEGAATSRCEAVALAFVLAEKAAEAAQLDGTGALGDRSGALLAPPSTGSGGAGGGVTHPPVAN